MGKEQDFNTELLTEEEAIKFEELLKKNITSYRNKSEKESDEEWLTTLLIEEIPYYSLKQAKETCSEIINSIKNFDQNIESIKEAKEDGKTKQQWLENKLNEAATGLNINEFGEALQHIDNSLYQANEELHDALTRKSDGQIKMSPNLHGNIAEHMVAEIAQLADLNNENISVEVRDVFTKNSVDISVKNLKTGQRQNYQVKFGKTAEDTIKYIKKGNYSNQRIIVPKGQVKKIKAAFPNKTIDDKIEAWGVKGKSFEYKQLKQMQEEAQKSGFTPKLDYNSYQTKHLAMSIGKKTGVVALQSAAISVGFNMASKVAKGEVIDESEMIETALRSGADTSIKTIVSGTLKVCVEKGMIKLIPKGTPPGVVTNIVCVGVENTKILYKVVRGEIKLAEAIEEMDRTTYAMVGGLVGAAKGAALGASLLAWIPVAGPVVGGLVGGTVGYLAGSKVGEEIHSIRKKVKDTVKKTAEKAWDGIKKVAKIMKDKVPIVLKNIFSF